MDGYPPSSLDHNVPFIVASGLTGSSPTDPGSGPDLEGQGTTLKSEIPALEGENADVLHRYLAGIDGTRPPWVSRGKKQPYHYKVVSVGRTFSLPPRKASPPEDIEPETEIILHSPLSPLSPASPLYPDGLIDHQWLQKHQELVPSIYLCFYTLTSDPSLATLHDNKLKTDINAVKATIQKSGYKTRLAVALMSDTSAKPHAVSEPVQERLENIRKGTGLDTGKSIFYIAPRESPDELTEAADAILTALYPQSVEYYRDLGRHARKKRNRGVIPQPTVPPTTGTSQTLSLPGWYVRYDFKFAVLSEFRREMDIAMRSYEQAYEGLLSQDVWDLIPSWSPRWNEARLLCDIIAIRILRCFLANEQTSMAVSRWQAHRDRTAEFIDHRGRGTNNYGWKAWEARWSLVMAGLVEKMDISGLNPSTGALYLPPEKGVPRERLYPWEQLHHTGYWYRKAARHTGIRRAMAYSMPEEDRRSPDTSPTTRATNKAYIYDTYLCPEPHQELPLDKPGVDYSQMIIDYLTTARSQFHDRGQHRLVAEISLECAKEAANLGQWDDVIALLRPVWQDMPFRKEGWTDITEDVNWTLRGAAVKKGLGEVVLAIDWELLHRKFSRRKTWQYDLSKSLENMSVSSKPTVDISDDTISSFLSSTFIFRSDQGKAGETATAQLIVRSDAFPDSAPVQLSELKVEFEGSLRPIVITHDPAASQSRELRGNTMFAKIDLKEGVQPETEGDSESEDLPSMCGAADLLLSPGQCRVFQLAIPLREPGEARASSVLVSVNNDDFDFRYTISFHANDPANIWVEPSGFRRKVGRADAQTVQVQPRPPKMEINLVNAREQYYANEAMDLEFELVNAEDEEAVTKLDIHVFGDQVPAARVRIPDAPEVTSPPNAEASKLAGLTLGTIKSSDKAKIEVSLDEMPEPGTLELNVRASYHLASDPGTRIVQKGTFAVTVVSPFETNYDMLPRLHTSAWPSLFDSDTIRDTSEDASHQPPLGLAQKWCLSCRYASFATEDLQIVDLDAVVVNSTEGTHCTVIKKPTLPEGGLTVSPRALQEVQFDVSAQKLSLDDRRASVIDLAFVIKWKRAGSSGSPAAAINTTTMPVPPQTVLSTEPRVIASLSPPTYLEGDGAVDGLVNLDITIENPSSHFLTFGLTMEPSDEFAFSGAKKTTLHVLPVSRRTTTYRMLPLVRGAFVRPGLVVRDKYFQKVLRIIPTEGMKVDKDGLLVWVPGDEDGEATAA